MSFRYVIEAVNKNGLKERIVHEIEKADVLLGRGSANDILLSGHLVSLAHAKLTIRDNTLLLEDLDSLSGVLVNGSLSSRKELKQGDELKIGDYRFTVTKEDSTWGLLEHREAVEASEDTAAVIAKQEKKLKLANYLPSCSLISLLLCLVIIVLYFAMPMQHLYQSSWTTGHSSNVHRMIENDCARCHATPFKQVQDEQCLTCHAMSEHSPHLASLTKSHPSHNFRCAECHMEHNDRDGLILKDSAQCATCHASMSTLLADAHAPDIKTLENHPEFRVSMKSASGSPEEMTRVSLANKEALRDPTQLKLNHKIHLEKDIRGEHGPVTLTCGSCHELSPDLKTIQPIVQEKHCGSCHSLGFDERLPDKKAPHGDSDIVYSYLFAEYAKLFLTMEEEEKAGRAKPGNAVYHGQETAFSRSSVAQESRATERNIFERTACQLCHMVKELDVPIDDNSLQSKFTVVKPNLPERWMPASIFSHGAHVAVRCESCHEGVRKSEQTSDVLLPGVANCKQCHSQQTNKPGAVVSECSMCHSYHDAMNLDDTQKQQIENLLIPLHMSSNNKSAVPSVGQATEDVSR